MADKTTLFKATLKTVKTKEKKFNIISGEKQIDKSILKRTKKSEFSVSAKNVAGLISKLKEYLLEIRKDYLNDAIFLGISQSRMTNLDREKIDNEAESFMKKCKDAINHLQVQAGKQKASQQARENKNLIVELLDKYLVGVCKLYSQQKAIRIKRDIDRKRISRLKPDPIYSVIKSNKMETDESGDTVVKNTNKQQNQTPTSYINKFNKEDSSKDLSNHHSQHHTLPEIHLPEQQPHLSEDDKLMLMAENEELYQSMSSMADEVRVIEGKVVEISQLQELFAEKILEQDVDIEQVAGAVVSSSEDINMANDEIRQAMKSDAGLRVWILFFILVCTFSLLFLDWYNA